MKRTIVSVVAAILVASVAGAVTYSGSLSTADGGLIGTSSWGSNSDNLPTTLAWTVSTDDTMAVWHYSYAFQVPLLASHPRDEIQYVHLETATNVKASDIQNLQFGALTPAVLDEVGVLKKRGIMPENMFGAQLVHSERTEDIEGGQEGHIMTWTFDTTKAPIWGDFYGNGVDPNEVINAGFTKNDVDPTDAPSDGSVMNNLLVPGPTGSTPPPSPPPTPGAIPEPLTMLMLSLVAIPLAKELRRRCSK